LGNSSIALARDTALAELFLKGLTNIGIWSLRTPGGARCFEEYSAYYPEHFIDLVSRTLAEDQVEHPVS
jgi:hypothetical protein